MTTDFSPKINQLFATTYHAAALQEADMQLLAAALEPMRGQLREKGDTLAIRAALDTAVGGNDDARAEKALLQLRSDFIAVQKGMWVADIEKSLETSPAEAWSLFLNRYVEAFYYWRTQWMCWWADAALGEALENKNIWFKDKETELRRIREQSRMMEHGRWPEAYPFLRELAENKLLNPKLRAQLWTVCGSIQMYYNTLPDARNDLDEAEKLFPELPYLSVCRADLERVAGNYGLSKIILEKHFASSPKDPEAHISLGRVFLEEKNWEEALRCFDKAIEADPGNASAYRNKLALWGKDETYFTKNREKIAEMVRFADRADPESELSNLLEAGYTYQAGALLFQTILNEAKPDAPPKTDYAALADECFAAATECFQKAHAADPERIEPMTALGYLSQLQQKYGVAAEWFHKVIQQAPGSVDGYWNLAALCAEQGEFAKAADWYTEALPHCPMFTRTLLVKAGEMCIAAGDCEKGKKYCLDSLKIDANFDFALNTLHDLSDKMRDDGFKDKTGTKPALDVLRAIRDVKGESYEASFQNRAGNVHYYFAEYQQAAEHYRRAIAADTSQAVYHDNLAGTLDKLSDQLASLPELVEALQEAKAAADLEPSNESYRQQTTRIERKLISMRHFGVLPDERSANISPLRVRFRDELFPFLVKDGDLVPELMQRIEGVREKFKAAYGLTIPGVRFSADWNIVPDANFVIDLDGIPLQQGWLHFGADAMDDPIDKLVALIEQNIQFNLADFIHYDSAEVSAKFMGKSFFYAAGFLQVVRVLLKQKISINEIDTIHQIYESGRASGKHIQSIAQEIRCHPAILPGLPVNAAASRTFHYLTPEQEEHILSNVGKSHCEESLWQILPQDPVFFEILEYLPKTEYYTGGHGQFVITQNPQVATLLNDLNPGTFFSRNEILNLSETEIATMPG